MFSLIKKALISVGLKTGMYLPKLIDNDGSSNGTATIEKNHGLRCIAEWKDYMRINMEKK